MRATRELPAELVLSGHGEPILDHVALIDERFRMHERRARKIRRMLDRGPLSAYEIALQMWGNVAVTQAYLTHLRGARPPGPARPRGAGRASEERDGVARFEAID